LKKFLQNIAIWGLLVILVLGSMTAYFAGPRTDFFYERFTTPKAGSLIIGSSRAAQGVQPEILNLRPDQPVFNYSFTYHESPYGECYLEACQKKFNHESGGVFILEVNPFILSNYKVNMEADEEMFDECETAPSNMWFVNHGPNFEYLIRNYSEDYRSLIGIKPRAHAIYLHRDGWLEIEIPFDTAYFQKNTEDKVRNYNELIKKMKPSTARWKALEEFLEFFDQYGEVVMVRIPVSPEMAEIEERYDPLFEQKIINLSKEFETPFLNYFGLNDSLYFTDGNHLHRSSAADFSKQLGRDIERILSTRR
jgi:hypothetical protein